MAAALQPTPPHRELQLVVSRNVSNKARSSPSRGQRVARRVESRHLSFPWPTGAVGHRVFNRVLSLTPFQSLTTPSSSELNPQQGCDRLGAKQQRIFGGGYATDKWSTSPGNSPHATIQRVSTVAGIKDKMKKGFRKVGGRRTSLEEQLEKGFKKVGLGRQFGQLPQWSQYVPLVTGGLQTVVLVVWTVYLKGDLRGTSLFNLSGEGLLTLLMGTNFVVGWLASQMSTWRVQALSPNLLSRGRTARTPNVGDFIKSFALNLIPYGNLLAWTRFAWKEGNSVSSLNALVYVVPSLVKLVLWSQGWSMFRVQLLAWLLAAVHRPFDEARVKNETLLAAADAKIESAERAKREKEEREKGPELTVDEMVRLQQRKELEDFDILLARSTFGSTTIPAGRPQDWSVSDIVLWLAQEGFARYGSIFAENDIDGGILLLLTDEDLRDDLGVQSLGDRRKLTQAIDRLKG